MFEKLGIIIREEKLQREHDKWVKEYTKEHGHPPVTFADWYREKYPDRIKNGLPRGCPRDYNWAALRGNCKGKKRKFSEFAGNCEECWNAYVDDFFFPDLEKRDEMKKNASEEFSKMKDELKDFRKEVKEEAKKDLPKVIEAVQKTDWDEVRGDVAQTIIEVIENIFF